MTAKKKAAFTVIAVLLVTALTLGAIEILVRSSGRAPWFALNLRAREPIMYEPDAELGWSPKPGRHVLPAYSAGAPNVVITLREDGTRTTGPREETASPAIVFIGCSFAWPLHSVLASVALLEERYTQAQGAPRAQLARPVTEALLLGMDQVTREHGAHFLVVALHGSPATTAHYLSFLREQQIDAIDCTLRLHPALQVRGEGHPNAEANRRWASCMESKVGDVLAMPSPQPERRALSSTGRGLGSCFHHRKLLVFW